jgi:hypothetical protein
VASREIDPDDIRAIMLMLMKVDATLEEIRDLLLEDDDGEAEEEPDS